MKICPACNKEPCALLARCEYPYTHDGPAIYGSKLADFLISEANMIDNGLLAKQGRDKE